MKLKVLVIDDDIKICELLKEFMEHRGYQVLIATSGEDGLEKFISERPQMIFLDIIMPEMDGLMVLQKIKDIDSEVDVIMATGVGDIHIAQRAVRMGAMKYLLKPLDLGYLVENVLKKNVCESL